MSLAVLAKLYYSHVIAEPGISLRLCILPYAFLTFTSCKLLNAAMSLLPSFAVQLLKQPSPLDGKAFREL